MCRLQYLPSSDRPTQSSPWDSSVAEANARLDGCFGRRRYLPEVASLKDLEKLPFLVIVSAFAQVFGLLQAREVGRME